MLNSVFSGMRYPTKGPMCLFWKTKWVPDNTHSELIHTDNFFSSFYVIYVRTKQFMVIDLKQTGLKIKISLNARFQFVFKVRKSFW